MRGIFTKKKNFTSIWMNRFVIISQLKMCKVRDIIFFSQIYYCLKLNSLKLPDCSMEAILSSSAAILLLVASTCLWTSFLASSIRLVLSIRSLKIFKIHIIDLGKYKKRGSNYVSCLERQFSLVKFIFFLNFLEYNEFSKMNLLTKFSIWSKFIHCLKIVYNSGLSSIYRNTLEI